MPNIGLEAPDFKAVVKKEGNILRQKARLDLFLVALLLLVCAITGSSGLQLTYFLLETLRSNLGLDTLTVLFTVATILFFGGESRHIGYNLWAESNLKRRVIT